MGSPVPIPDISEGPASLFPFGKTCTVPAVINAILLQGTVLVGVWVQRIFQNENCPKPEKDQIQLGFLQTQH